MDVALDPSMSLCKAMSESAVWLSMQGKDHTLFALTDGSIKFHTRKYPSKRRFVSVLEQSSQKTLQR